MAENNTNRRRLCPTRADGAHALIAHWITPSVCLERQRTLYHKCYTCQYRGLAADVILPDGMQPEPTPAPAAARANGKAKTASQAKSAEKSSKGKAKAGATSGKAKSGAGRVAAGQ